MKGRPEVFQISKYFLNECMMGAPTICFSLFAAPRPVGPEPMTRTSTLLQKGISWWLRRWRDRVLTNISWPLGLLMLRLWVLGPLASLEGVLGIVEMCEDG